MKRSTLFGLVALLACPLISLAQEQNPSKAAYLKWRDETFSQRPAGILTPHHAMATTLSRLNAQTLHLNFALVGKTRSHQLLIQPLKTSKLSDGRMEREQAGEAVTVNIGRSEGGGELPMVLHNIDVRAGEEANEMQVTWTFETEEGPFTSIHYLGFVNVKPISSVVGIER